MKPKRVFREIYFYCDLLIMSVTIEQTVANTFKGMSSDSRKNLVVLMKETFTEEELKLYSESLLMTFKYDSSLDFVVSAEDASRYLGSRKDNIKKFIIKNFKENIDYKVDPVTAELTMTIDTLKRACSISNTEHARKIREYTGKFQDVVTAFMKQPQPLVVSAPIPETREQEPSLPMPPRSARRLRITAAPPKQKKEILFTVKDFLDAELHPDHENSIPMKTVLQYYNGYLSRNNYSVENKEEAKDLLKMYLGKYYDAVSGRYYVSFELKQRVDLTQVYEEWNIKNIPGYTPGAMFKEIIY